MSQSDQNPTGQGAGQTRRQFVSTAASVSVGAALGINSAASYARVLGANDRINLGVVGVRSRGNALLNTAMMVGGSSVSIAEICDVDANFLAQRVAEVQSGFGNTPRSGADFRRMLDNRDVDAVIIATPDHTHAPFTIYAMQADKHVYVEKPCSYNPHESDLLIAANERYNKVVQMGNQQRSAKTSQQAVRDIRDGVIGRAYQGKAWYANNRGGIGRGSIVPVPGWLNWDLWQGPAPRRDYKDNYVHYNWHWFWHWGTGEINNNGLHEIDIARWALGVEYPERVISTGGRYHFDDDWEFYDTQIASYEFADGKNIVWEGRSCNGFAFHNRGRGVTIHGTNGTIMLDRNSYQLFDHQGKLVKEVKEQKASGTTDLVGAGALTDLHMGNFFNAIREGEALRSPISDGARSTLLCHLGNIAQKTGRILDIDTQTGHIKNDNEAMEMWKREYENGWKPEV